MFPFVKALLKTILYRRLLKNGRLKFKANGYTRIYVPSIYLLILGSMVLICELIVMRHEVHGFYLEVLREMNGIFYIKESNFGFGLYK